MGLLQEVGGSYVGVQLVFTHKHLTRKTSKATGLVDSVWFGLVHHPLGFKPGLWKRIKTGFI